MIKINEHKLHEIITEGIGNEYGMDEYNNPSYDIGKLVIELFDTKEEGLEKGD